MLQEIREKFTGTFALVILALLAIPFVFVGVGANYSFFSGSFIAKVDGQKIGLNFFENRYRQFVADNPQLVTADEVQRQQVRQQILDSLIYEQLIENFLNEAGYRISDEQVVESIRSIPGFRNDAGEFDRVAYTEALAAQGYTEARYEASQRVGLRRQQLQRAIGETGLVTPASYRQFINLAYEERLVTTANFTLETLDEEILIEDDAIVAYYEENPAAFQLPETADVEYLLLDRSEVAASIEVSEEELLQYYEENRYRYLQDEQREASHILITFGDDEAAAEAEAADLFARASAGEDFAELAREFSDDAGTARDGGSFGALTRTQFPGELGAAIFALDEGTVDGPIRTDFGFHVVKLDRVLPQGSQPLAQVRNELLTEMQERKADVAYRDLEVELGNALFDSPDLDDAAAAVGMTVQTATGITRQGGGPFGNNQAAIDAIFDPRVLTGGETSDLIELDSSRSVIVRLSQYAEATRQPLDEVREQIRGLLTGQEAERLLGERASALLAQVEGGAEFRGAAEAAGATVSEPLLISRQSQDVDPALRFAVFTSSKPDGVEPVRDVIRNIAGGYTVYSLDAVRPGRPESLPLAERDAGKAQRAADAGLADFSAFLMALREQADIVVNEDALAGSEIFQ